MYFFRDFFFLCRVEKNEAATTADRGLLKKIEEKDDKETKSPDCHSDVNNILHSHLHESKKYVNDLLKKLEEIVFSIVNKFEKVSQDMKN